MGGQTNVWASGRGVPPGLTDSSGVVIPRASLKLKDHGAHDDDHLEIETISSMFHIALGRGRQVA